MKLLGRDIDGRRLAEEIRARLSARGIREDSPDTPLEGEAPVDAQAVLVQTLEDHADPVQPPPNETPTAVGKLLRLAARGVLEELFGRQRAFNLHVRDFAAHLSVEVVALRARVAELEQHAAHGRRAALPSKRSSASKGAPRPKRRRR